MEYEIQALSLGWPNRLYVCFVDKNNKVRHFPVKRFWWHLLNVRRWLKYIRSGRPPLSLRMCPRVDDDRMPDHRFLYITLDGSDIQISDADVSAFFRSRYTADTFVKSLNEGVEHVPWSAEDIRTYRVRHGLCPRCGSAIGFEEEPSCTEELCQECAASFISSD
jgi:hypothetical protein